MSAEHVCTPHCEPDAHYATPMSVESTTAPTLADTVFHALVDAECTISDPQATAVETSAIASRAALAWVAARLDSENVQAHVANFIPLGFTDRDPYANTHEAADAILAEVKRLLGVTS